MQNGSTNGTIAASDWANTPATLKDRRQWVCWKRETRDGEATKLPYQLNGVLAKANDLATWCSFDEAAEASGRFSGIGYVIADLTVRALEAAGPSGRCLAPARSATSMLITCQRKPPASRSTARPGISR